MKSKIFFFLFLIPALLNAQEYLKEEADELFKSGRYWDAFFKYREIAKIPDFQADATIDAQIKNSSRAMYLWKKTEDNWFFRKYDIARGNMKDLLIINPYDPNKYVLPRITMDQANEMQRNASRQVSKEGTTQMIEKAIALYKQALDEGLKDETVFSLIKQCEMVLGSGTYKKMPTSYDVSIEKQRTREVQIIKNPF